MNKPYVIINCAMSADGKISLPNRNPLKISNNEDIKRMYKLRSEVDAVLIGVETVLTDDPKLTVKKKYFKTPKNPIRIILDSKCRTPLNSLVVNSDAKTFIITSKKCNKKFEENVKIINCQTDNEGYIDLAILMDILFNLGIKKLMVEGGGTTIWNFLKSDLIDDLYSYVAPIIIGGKLTPTIADGAGIKNKNEIIYLKIVSIKKLGDGILIHYKKKKQF